VRFRQRRVDVVWQLRGASVQLLLLACLPAPAAIPPLSSRSLSKSLVRQIPPEVHDAIPPTGSAGSSRAVSGESFEGERASSGRNGSLHCQSSMPASDPGNTSTYPLSNRQTSHPRVLDVHADARCCWCSLLRFRWLSFDRFPVDNKGGLNHVESARTSWR